MPDQNDKLISPLKPAEEHVAFPTLNMEEDERPTWLVPLQEQPIEVRVDHAMAIVRAHHERIAKSLVIMWGYQECADYLQKLVFDGNDPADKMRAGFKPEVMAALLSLLSLHRVTAR